MMKVYGTGTYDMALVGWNISTYPAYPCTFFGHGNPYNYQNEQLEEKCARYLVETDINIARNQAYEIQSLLATGLPAIYLFASPVYDAYRNLNYLYNKVMDGIGPGMYGAPSLVKSDHQ